MPSSLLPFGSLPSVSASPYPFPTCSACGHAFCLDCSAKIVNEHGVCAVCRQRVTRKQVIRVVAGGGASTGAACDPDYEALGQVGVSGWERTAGGRQGGREAGRRKGGREGGMWRKGGRQAGYPIVLSFKFTFPQSTGTQ